MVQENSKPPIDPDTQEQIELFEKFLKAVKAGRQVKLHADQDLLENEGA